MVKNYCPICGLEFEENGLVICGECFFREKLRETKPNNESAN